MKRSAVGGCCDVESTVQPLGACGHGASGLRQHLGHGDRSVRGGGQRGEGHGHERDQERIDRRRRPTRAATTP